MTSPKISPPDSESAGPIPVDPPIATKSHKRTANIKLIDVLLTLIICSWEMATYPRRKIVTLKNGIIVVLVPAPLQATNTPEG